MDIPQYLVVLHDSSLLENVGAADIQLEGGDTAIPHLVFYDSDDGIVLIVPFSQVRYVLRGSTRH